MNESLCILFFFSLEFGVEFGEESKKGRIEYGKVIIFSWFAQSLKYRCLLSRVVIGLLLS
jgi:hypothetical protein